MVYLFSHFLCNQIVIEIELHFKVRSTCPYHRLYKSTVAKYHVSAILYHILWYHISHFVYHINLFGII